MAVFGEIIKPSATILCDVWQKHKHKEREHEVNLMAPYINYLTTILRNHGSVIIHSPGETMGAYKNHAVRKKTCELYPNFNRESHLQLEKYFLKQHKSIKIKKEDYISDDGQQIDAILKSNGIRDVYLMGFHLDICIPNRTYGINNLNHMGYRVYLVANATRPYESPFQESLQRIQADSLCEIVMI